MLVYFDLDWQLEVVRSKVLADSVALSAGGGSLIISVDAKERELAILLGAADLWPGLDKLFYMRLKFFVTLGATLFINNLLFDDGLLLTEHVYTKLAKVIKVLNVLGCGFDGSRSTTHFGEEIVVFELIRYRIIDCLEIFLYNKSFECFAIQLRQSLQIIDELSFLEVRLGKFEEELCAFGWSQRSQMEPDITYANVLHVSSDEDQSEIVVAFY